MQSIILHEVRFKPRKVRLQIELQKTWRTQITDILKCYSLIEFSEFSDAQLNLTPCRLNLTSRKPLKGQIDTRWDLLNHQSEILHSLIFLYDAQKGYFHHRIKKCEYLHHVRWWPRGYLHDRKRGNWNRSTVFQESQSCSKSILTFIINHRSTFWSPRLREWFQL